MCSRLLVLVTLALTWISSILSGTSLIVPREGPGKNTPVFRGRITKSSSKSNTGRKKPLVRQPGPIAKNSPSDVDPGQIEYTRRVYCDRPSVPAFVTFKTHAGGFTRHFVQAWHGVPNFIAFEIAQGSDSHNKDLAAVPVVVTAYSPKGYIWKAINRRWESPPEFRQVAQPPMRPGKPTEDESLQDEVAAHKGEEVTSSTLYVGAWDPGRTWSKGTALWRHLLYILQDSYLALGPETITTYNYLIFQIAAANPDLSGMLFFDGSQRIVRKRDGSTKLACEFRLLSKADIQWVAADQASTWKRVIGYVPSQKERELGIFDMHTYLVQRGCM